jgi:diadenosine tetraphosphate (Ap4A) HIT family hydrolase
MCKLETSTEIWDQVLWQSDNFAVVPSKGGFVTGWLMVVPKVHVLNMARLGLSQQHELDVVVSKVAATISRKFGPPTAFEHGAVVPNSTFGCGVDHAHLHLVPLPRTISLRGLAESALDDRFELQDADPNRPHLRIREPTDRGFYTAHPSRALPRQFFRQLIWRSHDWGIRSYDYDCAPCVDQVCATIKDWRDE